LWWKSYTKLYRYGSLQRSLGPTKTLKEGKVDDLYLIHAILPCTVDVQRVIIVSVRDDMRKIVELLPTSPKNGHLHPLLHENHPPPPLMGSIGYLILMKKGNPKW